MTFIFKVAQGDLNFQANFPEPAFELFRDSLGLQRLLFTKLARHRVQLTDIRVDPGNGTLGDYSLLSYLFNFSVSVRIRLERVEIQSFDLARVDVNKLNEAGVDVLEAIRSHVPSLSFKTHVLSVGLHGKLEGISVREFLSRFVTSGPKNLGPSIGNGAVFYFGPDAERLMSAVTTDLSSLIDGGLYVRLHVIWDASKVPIEGLPGVGDKYLRDALTQLDLAIEGV